MRLIKNKETNKLIDISEFDYIIALRSSKNPKELADYSDLPETKKIKRPKFFKYIKRMPGGIGVMAIHAHKNRFALIQIAKELSYQNESKDSKYVSFSRQKLVAHILELAYNLGLLNSYTITARKGKENGTSKENEQDDSNKADSTKQPRSRKKTRSAKGNSRDRTTEVGKHSKPSSRVSRKSTEAESTAEAVSATEKSTS